MINMYAYKKRTDNVFYGSQRKTQSEIKDKISTNLTKRCVENLNEGVNDFISLITKTVMQEK